MNATWGRTALRAAALSLLVLAARPAWATPMVGFETSDLGGGLFLYELILGNAGGAEALSGLNVLKGNSVFGLDDSSLIGAPAGWDFFAPFPPFADDLVFFSLDPSTDVPIDGSLSGFSFVSDLDPSRLRPGDFMVEAIGSESAAQIGLGDAKPVPAPATLVLMLIALAGLGARSGVPRG